MRLLVHRIGAIVLASWIVLVLAMSLAHAQRFRTTLPRNAPTPTTNFRVSSRINVPQVNRTSPHHYTCFGYCPYGPQHHHPYYTCFGYCPSNNQHWTCLGYCPWRPQPYPHYTCLGYCPWVNPYWTTPYVPYVDPYAGYFSGTADVINAQANYMVSQQQAQLLREQVRQAQMSTGGQTYDQWLYERGQTPELQSERNRVQTLATQPNLDPPISEIWSGKALNDLLADLQKYRAQGVQGPPAPLDDSLLGKINVVPTKGVGNFGLLKEGGKLDWPLGLRVLAPALETQQIRDRMDKLLPAAIDQAARGAVDPGLVQRLEADVARLKTLVLASVGITSLEQYAHSRRFVDQLEDAVKVLRQRDADHYLSGKYAARGGTVPELIDYMTRNGLRFAPVTAGRESAYVSLYQALAAYATAVRNPATQR